MGPVILLRWAIGYSGEIKWPLQDKSPPHSKRIRERLAGRFRGMDDGADDEDNMSLQPPKKKSRKKSLRQPDFCTLVAPKENSARLRLEPEEGLDDASEYESEEGSIEGIDDSNPIPGDLELGNELMGFNREIIEEVGFFVRQVYSALSLLNLTRNG